MGIDAFLHTMDAGTVSRGRAYYIDGRVRDVRRMGDRYSAAVMGSAGSVYRVRILMPEGGAVLRYSCDCPCANACKHIAAVLMMIRHGEYRTAAPPRHPDA